MKNKSLPQRVYYYVFGSNNVAYRDFIPGGKKGLQFIRFNTSWEAEKYFNEKLR